MGLFLRSFPNFDRKEGLTHGTAAQNAAAHSGGRRPLRRCGEWGLPAAVTGLAPVHRAQMAAALALDTGRSLVAVCDHEGEANRLAEDLEVLLGKPCRKLYGRELFIRAGTVASRQWELERVATLYELSQGRCPLLVCTAEGLLQLTSPPQRLGQAALTLSPGGRQDLGRLPGLLVEAGYTRCDQVEGVGQFALRGGILDVYSPMMAEPVRCEFFDDEIDSLGSFDTTTQRRTGNLSSALLLPRWNCCRGRGLPPPLTTCRRTPSSASVRRAGCPSG